MSGSFVVDSLWDLGQNIVCHQFPDEGKATWLPLYKQTEQYWR